MEQKIKALEQLARPLEPDPAQRKALLDQVLQYTNQFINDLPNSKAYYESTHEGVALHELSIDERSVSIEELLKRYAFNVDETGLNPASGRHLGYIPGGGIFHSAIADYLAAVGNRYAGLFFGSPGAVRLENQVIRWLCSLIGYAEQGFGNLTSGGSIANLAAIASARDVKKIKSRNVETSVVYLTQQVHHCVLKALRIAGLWEAQIRTIKMDDRFRMRTDLLETSIQADIKAGLKPFLVVASAGTTDVGSIDPLDKIADIAEVYNLWFHIDAAYGGAFLLAAAENENDLNLKAEFKGIERSDSVTIDPHKGFFLPYGLGAILVKDISSLYKTNSFKANYLQDTYGTAEPSPSDLSPELTKHFRGLRFWLPLQLIGTAPFKAALEEKIWLTRYFYEKVQAIGFEVGPYPQLSVAIYRYVPSNNEEATDFNQAIVENLRKEGTFFVSSTTIEKVYWIRIAILSFRTHLREIDNYLAFLEGIVKSLEEEMFTKAQLQNHE